MTAELVDRVAIISGGLGDIGRACAIELARRGADVAVGDCVDNGRAEPLQAEIEQLGRRFRFDLVDVADAEAVTGWVLAVEREIGVPDLIIPCAAVTGIVPVRKLTADVLRKLLEINFMGSFHLTQAAAQRLLGKNRPGRIVFMGSWAAHAPHSHVPAYCVSKAALRMLAACMALEYAPHGILVNEVAPGFVEAGVTLDNLREDPGLRQRCWGKVPIREIMQPQEVAVQVAHLCDPRNRNMTGSVLLCDGGLSLVRATWRGFNDDQNDDQSDT